MIPGMLAEGYAQCDWFSRLTQLTPCALFYCSKFYSYFSVVYDNSQLIVISNDQVVKQYLVKSIINTLVS